MSTLSALNNVQKQFSDLAPSSISNKNKVLGGAAFEKTLDFAIKNKGLVIPAPANLAVDLGLGLLGEKGLLPTAGPTSIKDNIEGVFGELSIGIAGSFVAALSGDDSATAVTPVANQATKREKNNITPHPECLAHEKETDEALISADNISDTKKVLAGITPYLPDNKALPIANTALSSLEDILLDNEEQKFQRKS